jgi:hypothetical protein
MTGKPARTPRPPLTPDQITDSQREKLLALIKAEPYAGHADLAARAGIHGTTAQRRQFVKNDPETQAAIAEARGAALDQAGLNVPHLFVKLARVVNTDDHASQLRAIQYALTLQGVHGEVARIEVTGADGDPVEVSNTDVAAAVDRFTTTIRRLADRQTAEPGGTVRDAPAGQAELAP